ncbi:MAG: AAA family ATPase [Cyanobacteria bacterium TGS_CYA1]|nr:AAA family ATPase [Cyanobacteria bacterium TGS_CYA1]
MNIDRIVIRNFRNFEFVDFSLMPGVSCIIGDNNSGKSNLLHAIRLVCDVNLSNQARQLSEHDFHSGADISAGTQILVSIEFTDFLDGDKKQALLGSFETEEGRARLCFRFRPRRKVIEQIENFERLIGSLTIDDYNIELTAGGDGDSALVDWNEPLGSKFSLLDLQGYHVTYLHALRDVVSDLRKQHVSPLKKLLSTIETSEEERQVLVNLLKEANSKISSDFQLKTLGTIIENAFRKGAGETYPTKFKVGVSDPSWASIERSLSILLSNQSLEDFEPFRNGLGLNNVLYICMLTEYFHRKMTSENVAGQLLLIEEPEAHIHPQLQRVLHSALKIPEVQTFITTHSTHVTSNSRLESYVILNSKDGKTQITGASELALNLSEKEIADLERYLDATRSTILFAKKVLLVEGPAELYVIPELINQVLNFDLDRLGISVISIHGKHFQSYAKLFSKEGLKKKCAILTDGDLNLQDTDDESITDPAIEENLLELENEYVRVFQSSSTFEKELTMHGFLDPLRKTANEFNATRTSKLLSECIQKKNNGENTSSEIKELREKILRLAIKVGKGRFAQVLSRNLKTAKVIPQYISDAISWLINDDSECDRDDDDDVPF